jgi:hypothetical protein
VGTGPTLAAPPFGRGLVSPAGFYCVADERYFLGAVGVLNSLRLHGHRDPLYVLDCGLSSEQRELLARHATVVAGDPRIPPWLSKTVAPLRHPSAVMVLIDTDMIVTRPLHELIERAAESRIVTFENDRPRFVAEWGELLGLGVARPLPYVSSGLVVCGGAIGSELLELLDDRQARVDMDRTLFGEHADDDYAFRYPEQDVLNAILCTRIDPSRVDRMANRLAANPPFAGLRLRDRETLRCAFADGTEPYVLHHFHRKPWLDPVYHGIYSRLLARLLLADDVELRVPAEQVPLRMRSGPLARVERTRVDVLDVLRRRVLHRAGARR